MDVEQLNKLIEEEMDKMILLSKTIERLECVQENSEILEKLRGEYQDALEKCRRYSVIWLALPNH